MSKQTPTTDEENPATPTTKNIHSNKLAYFNSKLEF